MHLIYRLYLATLSPLCRHNRKKWRVGFWLRGLTVFVFVYWAYSHVMGAIDLERTLTQTGAVTPAHPKGFDYKQIKKAHVFDVHAAEKMAPDSITKKTPLSLQLVGTIKAGGESIALISVEKKPPDVFWLGQSILPDATLYIVDADSITILRANGILEKLKLRQSRTTESSNVVETYSGTTSQTALEHILETRQDLPPRVREVLEQRRYAPRPPPE